MYVACSVLSAAGWLFAYPVGAVDVHDTPTARVVELAAATTHYAAAVVDNNQPGGGEEVIGGLGACCLATGACVLTVEADCPLVDGAWQGPGSDCSPSSCIGACCLGDGSCTDVIAEDCVALGGPFFPYTECATHECLQPGACCLDDGTCRDVLQSVCEGPGGLSGIWHEDTDCTSFACPPGAACCADDGTCIVRTEQACAGTWDPASDTCDPNPCPQPLSACCFLGECVGELIEADCVPAGGSSFFDITCDDPTFSCRSTAACCQGGACLGDLPYDDCSFLNGDWHEGAFCADPAFECPPGPALGVCCQSGQCRDITQSFCFAFGGPAEWFPGESCFGFDCPGTPPEVGACCVADTCVADATRQDCIRFWGGIWNSGQSCADDPPYDCAAPFGACCLAGGGECVNDTTRGACEWEDGEWYVDEDCADPTFGCSLRGDCNDDGRIDLADYDVFVPCVSGPTGAPVATDCLCVDVDRDLDVDLADFAAMQAQWSAPITR